MMHGHGSRLLGWAVALLLLLAARQVAAQEILFEDSFNSTARAKLQRWRILGATTADFWYMENGALNTGDGNTFDLGASYAIVDAPGALSWSDYTVSARIQPKDADRGGRIILVARFVDANNFYFASMSSVAGDGGNGGQRQIELVRFSGGAEQELAMITTARGANLPNFGMPDSGPYDFRFSARGQTLTVTLNGVDVLTATDPTFPKGSAGVGQLFSIATFDDFRITTGGAAAAGTPALASATPVATRPAPSGGGDWRITCLQGLRGPDAQIRARELEAEGIRDVTYVADESGLYTVYIGRFKTEAEAIAAAENIQVEQGLAISGVNFVVEGAGSAAPGADRGTRVRVEDFPTRDRADQLKTRIMFDGFYPVDVIEGTGQFIVYVGPLFQSREPADRLLASLKEKGYTKASTQENVEISRTATAFTTNPVTRSDVEKAATAAGISLSQTESNTLANLLEAQRKAAETGDVAGAQAQLANEPESTRKLLGDIYKTMEETRIKEERLRGLSADFDNAIASRNITAAEAALAGIKATDPTFPSLGTLQRSLERLRSEASETPAVLAERAAAEARAAEMRGDLNAAAAGWETVRRTVTSGVLFEEAAREIVRIRQTQQLQANPPAPADSGGSETLAIIISVIAVVVVLGAIGFFVYTLKGRQRDKAALQQAQARTASAGSMKTAKGGSSLSGMGGVAPNTPMPVFQQEVAPATPPTVQPMRPNTPTPLPHEQDDGSLAIPGVVPGTAPAPQVVNTEANERIRPGLTSPSPYSGGPVTPVPASPVPASPSSGMVRRPDVAEGSDAVERPSTEFRMPSSAAIPLHPSSSSGDVHVRGTFPPGTFYEQSFEDEAIGEVPRGWKGSYDYSSLTVVDGGADGGRCMRFDKKLGTGSAYYSLKFPDASGKLCLEFDIRCDDKNRYLIGFYIEKDEDFRQAISTIVHRTNQAAPPMLRLQTEQTPYEFKKWVHVKYIIDLPRSLVDGWVDDLAVANGVRLIQAPKVLNTLSLRDNSNTVGVLLIDNIRITRVS